MTIPEYLAALPVVRNAHHWKEVDGYLHSTDIPGRRFSLTPMVALAEQQTGRQFCWSNAGRWLGLSDGDSKALMEAEDQNMGHDSALAQAIREALGMTYTPLYGI